MKVNGSPKVCTRQSQDSRWFANLITSKSHRFFLLWLLPVGRRIIAERSKPAENTSRNSCRFLFGELYEVPICLIDSYPLALSFCVSRSRTFSLSFCRRYELSLLERTTSSTQSWAAYYITRTLPFRISTKKKKKESHGYLERAKSNSINIDSWSLFKYCSIFYVNKLYISAK